MTCPSCGFENSPGAKFCSECGTALVTEAAPAREVRKTVTVLFSDVTGSTALGERLDPESLRRVMSRYFDEVRSVLERHGGTVEKFIGDAVMAVFGIPVLDEDDALRAVRAAVDLRGALAKLNEEFGRRWGASIAVRTGVNTGEVVAGDVARRESFATGDAVNVAARLEQTAQPGEILIGDQTYRLVRDAVRVEAVEPLVLKGKEEPTPAWRLLDVVEGAPAFSRRLDSPLVGRERERALLQQAFERAAGEQACHLFALLGAAGVGKSRLAQELCSSVEEPATVLSGRCLPYGEGITFWPLVDVVKTAAGMSDELPADVAREKIAALLEGESDRAPIAERVAAAIGLADADAPAEETFWAVRKLLEALARRRPLVVLFEDLHWGEPTFLDLVEHVADWSRDAPILLLCLARPELLDRRPGWGGGKLNATSVLLEPLTEAECDRLLENLLGQADLDERARERIGEAAEGNPLFVEEMLAMLIDDGLLRRDNGSWIPTVDLAQVSVPPTTQALLAARLDRLEGGEREVIARASVVGKVFERGAVTALAPEPLRPAVPAHLMALVRKEMIRPDRTTFAAEDAFRFRHILLRDAAYAGMPKQLRAELHEQLADWLEAAAGERVAEYEEIVGYHLEEAHSYWSELGQPDESSRSLAQRAGQRLGAAGRRALARHDMTAAVNLLGRAASLLPAEDPSRPHLLLDLSAALSHAGDFRRAEASVAEAAELAAGDEALEAYVDLARCDLQIFQASTEADSIRRAAERAVKTFDRLGDDRGLATAWRLVSATHWVQANAGKSADAARRALEYARRAGERQDAIRWMLTVAVMFGPTPRGLEEVDVLLREARGRPSLEAQLMIARGFLLGMRGEFAAGRRQIRKGRGLLRELGETVSWAATAHAEGGLELWADDLAAAERVLRESQDALEAIGERGYLSTTAAMLAETLYRQHRLDEALNYSEISERAGASDDLSTQMYWRAVRAEVLARRGRFDEAEPLAREAVRIAEATDYLDHHGDMLVALAEVLTLAGRQDEALPYLREAVALFERKGNLVSAEKTRARLRDLAPA